MLASARPSRIRQGLCSLRPAAPRSDPRSAPGAVAWWSSGLACAHAGVVSVLTPAEVLIAARRLAGARPHLAAVAGIAHREDLWQLCREELRSRRPHRRLGYPRPLVRRRRRGHAAARGAATRR